MSPALDGRWSARRFLALGFMSLAILVFGLGGWSALARIAGAVIAPGTVEVEGNRQVVQHLTGGVIEAILARDGDRVEAGQVLIRFEGDKIRSDLAVTEGQLFEIIARKDRLAAERDGLDAIAFDPELLARARTFPDAAALIAGQNLQFETGRAALAEEASALRKRMAQIERQIEGLAAERSAAERQADFTRQGLVNQEKLLAQGLTRQAEVLAPQRELARLEGVTGQTDASTAENRARIAEIEIEILRLTTQVRKDAIAELRDLEFREIELRERRAKLKEELARLELRAPVSGLVYGSKADTLGAVVRPADPILFVVPQGVPFVVRARIEPIHIDQVRIGQDAVLRFSAFNARTSPEVNGSVIAVSADTIEDDRTGLTYYRADIRIDEGSWAKLGAAMLLPGMPVEAFIKTEERSPLSYLIKPLADYFNKAFRES
jgi:HlyD family secretion protein